MGPLEAPRLETAVSRREPARDPAVQVRQLQEVPLADPRGGRFHEHVSAAGLGVLRSAALEVLQVNVGRVCNQTCAHCHVDAGPRRTESMDRATADLCLEVLARSAIHTLDITGGAPELNPSFRHLVRGARGLGRRVIDRCNLTVLLTPRCENLPAFLAEHEVEVVASLPHYRRVGTDKQRGEGVFEASIEALRRLNAAGYGDGGPLRLVLMTNPVGAFLPSGQASLEREWKRELERLHGVRFDALHSLTNMPIGRYLDWLEASGNLQGYLQRLVAGFNPAAVGGLMCRSLLSVGWDGRLFDCDFNQMLDLELGEGAPRHVRDLLRAPLGERAIVTGRHCFGCTAGSGSSCGGQLQ